MSNQLINCEQINEVLDTIEVVDRHSYFQLRYFVIGKEPTHQSKMWRCLKELKARRETMNSIELQIEESNDLLLLLDLERKELKDNVDSNTINQEKIKIKLRQLDRKEKNLKDQLKSLEERSLQCREEATYFYVAFKELEKQSPLKPFDDFDSQKEYWNNKFAYQLGLDNSVGSVHNVELISSILSLNDDAPIKKQVSKAIMDNQKKALEKANG